MFDRCKDCEHCLSSWKMHPGNWGALFFFGSILLIVGIVVDVVGLIVIGSILLSFVIGLLFVFWLNQKCIECASNEYPEQI